MAELYPSKAGLFQDNGTVVPLYERIGQSAHEGGGAAIYDLRNGGNVLFQDFTVWEFTVEPSTFPAELSRERKWDCGYAISGT